MAETLRSLGELGAHLAPEVSKRTINRTPLEGVEPVYLRKLAERIGNQNKTGDLIGISGSHVSNCLSANESRLSYELAAKAVLTDMDLHDSKPTVFCISVPSDQVVVLDTFLRGMGLKAVKL